MTTLLLSLCLVATQVQGELPPIGTNLAPFSAGSTQWPLVDAFKMARPWAPSEGSGTLDVDDHGHVKSLKDGQFAETVVYETGHCPRGKYTLSWTGSGQFEAVDGSVLSPEGENRASVDVQGERGIKLRLTKVDPNDPPRNIRLAMPGYSDTMGTEPFHPVFLQRMSLYRLLRFTDWQATDGSRQKVWGDRPTLDDATFTRGDGAALEVMLDLANEKSATPWFSVPHMADDEYVRQMAKLIQSRLKPGLKLAVEYSNECWNQAWPQNAWCRDMGIAAKLSEDATEAGLRYYAQRSAEVFAIFEEIMGGKDRLMRVVGADMGNLKAAETILGWKRTASKADFLAVAPYFGASVGKPGDLDTLFGLVQTEVKGRLRDRMFEVAGLANRNRLRLVSYGGGQALVASPEDASDAALNKLFDDANRDIRMADTYTLALKAWRSAGGTLFVHTYDCGPWTTRGRWGTIEYQDQDPQVSMKNRALIQYALFPDR